MTYADAMFLFILFSRISTATMLVPIGMALFKWKYLIKSAKVFLGYRVFAFFFNLIEQVFIWYSIVYTDNLRPYLEYWEISDTNFLAILYYLNNFAFLGWFYYLVLPRHNRVWVGRIALFLFIAALVNYLFIEGYQVYGYFNPNANALFVVGSAFLYLRFTYRIQLTMPLSKNPYFWFSIALIILYLSPLILSFIGNIVFDERYILFVSISILRNLLIIISQILLTIGFFQIKYAKYIDTANI